MEIEFNSRNRRYKAFSLEGKTVYVHRFIWESVHGPIPEGLHIDHINGDKHDNRIENLRLATPSQNAQNRVHRGGSSKHRGVSWSKQHQRWKVQIMVNRKNVLVGFFSDEIEASDAYKVAAAKHHTHNPITQEKAPTDESRG